MSTTDSEPKPTQEDPSASTREQAIARVKSRRDFGGHLVCYLAFNAVLVSIWALTGGGYFWPAWVLGLWGAGLVMHAWEAFARRPITEADIDAELRRLS